MSSVSAPTAAAKKGHKVRLGLILRLAIAVALIVVVAVDGRALATRATSGPQGHYTVVVKGDASALAKAHGLKVEKLITNGSTQAFVTSTNVDTATELTRDAGVSYIEMDNAGPSHSTWLETVKAKFGH